MALETATFIADLVPANPGSTDPKSQGDDHLRMIKAVLQATFAGFGGAVILSGTEAQGATVNDYVLTVSPAPTSYASPMIVVFKANHTNTSTATFKLVGLAPLPFTSIRSSIIWMGGEVTSGDYAVAIYDSGSASMRLWSGNDSVNRNGDTIVSLNITGALTVGALETLNSLAVSGTATGITPTAGDNSTKFATTAFVVGLGMSALLPGQTGKQGQSVVSDGSTANWGVTATEALVLQARGIW